MEIIHHLTLRPVNWRHNWHFFLKRQPPRPVQNLAEVKGGENYHLGALKLYTQHTSTIQHSGAIRVYTFFLRLDVECWLLQSYLGIFHTYRVLWCLMELWDAREICLPIFRCGSTISTSSCINKTMTYREHISQQQIPRKAAGHHRRYCSRERVRSWY